MVKVLVKAVKMPSNNEKWRDALIQRHILVLMGMVSVHILLNDTEPIIASLIRESLRIAPEQLTKRLSAANSLIREIRSIRFKIHHNPYALFPMVDKIVCINEKKSKNTNYKN